MPTTNKNNIYDKLRSNALQKGYIFGLLIVALFIVFIVRIFILQNTNVKEITENYIDKNYREAILKPARGNLYATDGAILATTVMKYDIYLDFKSMKENLYKEYASTLTDSLSKMFNKPKSYFRAKFEHQRKIQNQYYLLVKGLDFDNYNRIRHFPIFDKGQNKGGFIVNRVYERELATSKIGTGTIGVYNDAYKSGFEWSFNKYLKGTDGSQYEQRVNSTQWKPIDYWKVKEPIDGDDIYTTLDLRIQDIAHSALEKQLIKFNADHGSVLVMESKTGKIRAMVNLRRNAPGVYSDAYNYSIKDITEPGSTFKVVSLLTAMDDGLITDETTVNTGNGRWTYAGQNISDGHGGGTFDISEVLSHSSNVGSAKLITKCYASDPWVFINHLKDWKMLDKMNIELQGIAAPFIVTPKNKRWNKATLASLAYGYSVRLNLLQLLTFYNGIANRGKMIKPLFIDKRVQSGKIIYEAKPEVMVKQMASPKAIEMMTKALEKAVEKGTARSIYTPNLKIAGKTGTARFEYWTSGPAKYQASFAGFYPVDDPQYTCIVMVNQPDTKLGYYGASVAAPVFKEIAGRIFFKKPQNVEKDLLVDKKVDLNKLLPPSVKIKIINNEMPSVIGLAGKDAVPQIENFGYSVEFKGVGRVTEQFPAAGTALKPHQKIYLTLQQ